MIIVAPMLTGWKNWTMVYLYYDIPILCAKRVYAVFYLLLYIRVHLDKI